MAIKSSIDNKKVFETFKTMQQIPDQLVEDAGKVFRDLTPIRTENARSKTKTVKNEIRAEYLYAGRLDQGYSSQAPDGMSEPTIAYIQKRFKQLVEK